jgi:hypothetical protein
MATTNSGFAKVTLGGVVALLSAPASAISAVVSALSGTRMDRAVYDLASAGYDKNGAGRYTLSGTTPKTIDLTDTTSGAQSYAGDTTFASYTQLVLLNDGAASITVGSGASNGATWPMSGTVTLAAGESVVISKAAAVTVDGTHKAIDVTPTSGGSFVICVGGA